MSAWVHRARFKAFLWLFGQVWLICPEPERSNFADSMILWSKIKDAILQSPSPRIQEGQSDV